MNAIVVGKEYIQFVESIVNAEFPDEIDAFELGGEYLITDTLSGKNIKNLEEENTKLKLMDRGTIKETLNLTRLITTTYPIIKDSKALMEQLTTKEGEKLLENKWRDALESEGMDKEKANGVATRFVGSLINFISAIAQFS